MKIIGFLLILIGVLGSLISFAMFGDIAIASFIASITAFLSGIGFILVNKRL